MFAGRNNDDIRKKFVMLFVKLETYTTQAARGKHIDMHYFRFSPGINTFSVNFRIRNPVAIRVAGYD
jgi:hypothetical protein